MSLVLSRCFARVRGWSPAGRWAGAACVLVAAGLLAWAGRLWPEWQGNPDLSHGFLAVPAVVILWIRAREGAASASGLGGARLAVLSVAAAGVLALAALFATVYAVALDWASVPTLFLLSVAVAAGLALASLQAAGRGVRWIAPGWPVWVMWMVVVLSAPLPPGTYARLTLGLQEAITVGVVETLRLFGVPALRSGNIINLGATSVGVEEACSGVRSLVSCVLAGLVLSALMLRSPWRRALLIGLSAPLALLTNFARSLTLTLLASKGVDITGAWHDWLGYAVLGLTTGALAALACGLEEPAVATEAGAPMTTPERAGARERAWRTANGVLAVASLGLAAAWFVWVAARVEAPAGGRGTPPPLAELVPASPGGGWRVTTRPDLERFAGILHTAHLLERTYSKTGDDGRAVQFTVYIAWWPAGAASVSTVAAHTPEACWPGAGWRSVPGADGRRDLPLPGGGVAAEAEQRSFVSGDYPQTVWFWHLVAGRPMRAFDPRSWREQLRLFWERGVRRDEEQAFVRLSCNVAWAEIAADPLVAEILTGAAGLGVPVR